MPHFRAKKRCQYGGNVYDKNAVEQFFTPISAQSWEAMDAEGEELLIYPDEPKTKNDEVQISGLELAELQGLYSAVVADLATERAEGQKIKVQLEELEDDFGVLKVENDTLAKAAEAATELQQKVAALKKMVADNENKSVLEEAITAL
ncbi:hypothetical protein [Halodesulfovibrio aestuarii]|uniref:Uncharacterized protein n=1 Tax=Halodesulfovibrio aestuarii TaxID=126333 RepID=A0ABV4JMX3_9BACT